MDERQNFVAMVMAKAMPVTEACRRFGVSRKAGYKWLERYHLEGVGGLGDKSRAPKRTPWALSEELTTRLVELRERRPTWGPRKLLHALAMEEPALKLPAASTVGELLKRKGLVKPRRRKRWPTSATPTQMQEATAPNDCWAVDFKGDFIVNHARCYPLTATDGFSRFILGCTALPSTATEGAKPVFVRLFEEYGLPNAIRSDNGAPFASVGLGGLSALSVWWVRLGIRLERIPPGKPQHNGRHERMHRTLKAEACMPTADSFETQQQRFDDYRLDFNTERPHEALEGVPPSAVYEPSQRSYPSRLPELEYPSRFALRRVHHTGVISLLGQSLYISSALAGEVVGLEEVDDGLWHLHFGPLLIGVIDARGLKLRLLPSART